MYKFLVGAYESDLERRRISSKRLSRDDISRHVSQLSSDELAALTKILRAYGMRDDEGDED